MELTEQKRGKVSFRTPGRNSHMFGMASTIPGPHCHGNFGDTRAVWVRQRHV